MFKKCVGSFAVTGLFSFGRREDAVKDSKTLQAIEERRKALTGRDRLYMMYSLDNFGSLSPELRSVIQTTSLGLFTGAFFGGSLQARNAYDNFLEQNKATTFQTHFEAKKLLTDRMTVAFGKGAFMWGWRLALFTSVYSFFTTSVSVYRGQTGIIEHLVGGCVAGASYKFNLGLRGMTVGALLGTALGGVAGTVIFILTKLTGTSMEDVRYWQFEVHQSRKQGASNIYKKMDEASAEKIAGSLFQNHDRWIGPEGISLDALDKNSPSEAVEPKK